MRFSRNGQNRPLPGREMMIWREKMRGLQLSAALCAAALLAGGWGAGKKEAAERVVKVVVMQPVKMEFVQKIRVQGNVETKAKAEVSSRISGTLNNDADPIKTFIDTFPAGTLSGAPKVRAMQLISELETHNRGAYGGCIGFIGLNGSLNQAITIRTFVSRNGVLWFQAGGGIVAQSNDEYELQEVNNKLGALKKAIIMAEKM